MILAFDDLELDTERLELRRAGSLLKADRVVLLTLACLAKNAGRLVTKDELVEEVWEGRPVADTVITVATARLRKTLGQKRGEPRFIENVYGRGYRFVRPVATRSPSRPPPAVLEAGVEHAPPFVGRARVLHRLRQALAQAQAGRGRVCALLGEAGIGKTEAVEVFERELHGSGVAVAWGFCHAEGDAPPLAPWRRLLAQASSRLGGATQEQRPGPLAAVLEELEARATPDAPTAQVATMAGGPGQRLFEAVSRALALAAEELPLVLVLDDLHRADAASLDLLGYLVDEIGHTRLLVVATLRSAPDVGAAARDERLAYLLGHRGCERVMLEPLAPSDVERYVGAVLQDPGHALAKAVFAKSEGNPFYMVELTRQLADMERPRADALEVPEAALELVRQRIALLDAASRQLLSAAAVLGRSFELPVLQAMTGSEAPALMANLDDALGVEVVVAAPDSMTAFAFGHELMRAALYDALSPAERRRWHLRAALALEQREPPADAAAARSADPALHHALAYHFHAALPGGDPRKTVTYCRLAAAAASRMFAPTDVVRYMRHALEALELVEHPSVRLRMALLQVISMHSRTTDPEEFERVTREIVRLASDTGDGPNLVMAGAMLNPSLGLPPGPGAGEAFERALALLPPKLVGMRAVALAGLAGCAPACYDAERARSLLDEAIEHATKLRSDTVDHGVTLCRLYLRGGPCHVEEERQSRRRLEELARDNPVRMPVLPSELAFSRAVTALQRGETGGALDALEYAVGRCREIDQREGLWYAERARVLIQHQSGAATDPVGELSLLHQRAERQGLLRTASLRAFDRAVVLPPLGQAPVLDASLRRALAHRRSDPPSVWALKVRALATAGWVEAAHASLSAVSPQALARLPCDRDYLGTLGHLARAALLLGAHEYVEAIHPLLAPYPEGHAVHMCFFSEGLVAPLLDELARAR